MMIDASKEYGKWWNKFKKDNPGWATTLLLGHVLKSAFFAGMKTGFNLAEKKTINNEEEKMDKCPKCGDIVTVSRPEEGSYEFACGSFWKEGRWWCRSTKCYEFELAILCSLRDELFDRIKTKDSEITTLRSLVQNAVGHIDKLRKELGFPPRDGYSYDSLWEDAMDNSYNFINCKEVKEIMKNSDTPSTESEISKEAHRIAAKYQEQEMATCPNCQGCYYWCPRCRGTGQVPKSEAHLLIDVPDKPMVMVRREDLKVAYSALLDKRVKYRVEIGPSYPYQDSVDRLKAALEEKRA